VKRLVVLAAAVMATLCSATPALAQDVEDTVECSGQYSPEALPTADEAEECGGQVQEAFDAALDAAAAAVGAADAAEASAGAARGTVDGEAAFRAALGAARETGVDESTARAVAVQAVASVSTGSEPEAGRSPESDEEDERVVDRPGPQDKETERETERGAEEASGETPQRASDRDSDRDEITVLPTTGGAFSRLAPIPGALALLVGAGLLVRRLVR